MKAKLHGYSLNDLVQLAREHWQEFLPSKFKALTEAGTLEQSLKIAARLTIKEMDDLIAMGASQYEAWEACRENHLLLKPEPSIEEEPENAAFETLAGWNQVQGETAEA